MRELMDFALSVPDFRRQTKGNIRHKLSDMIVLMVLGRASGHHVRASIIESSTHNLKKFRKIGLLENGVPSEPTLCRIERMESIKGQWQTRCKSLSGSSIKNSPR